MRSYGLFLSMGLVLGASGAQSAIIYDLSPTPVYPTAVEAAANLNFNGGTCGSYVSCVGDYPLTTGLPPGRFSGADLVPLLAKGGETTWASNLYVNFYFTDDDPFDPVTLDSNYAFESDNHAYARLLVPEPATLALLALGMAGLWVSRHKVHTH